MKRMISKKSISTFLFFLIFALGVNFTVFSQNPPPDDPGGDEDVPITGIEWLLIGGGAFGARKIYMKVKRKD